MFCKSIEAHLLYKDLIFINWHDFCEHNNKNLVQTLTSLRIQKKLTEFEEVKVVISNVGQKNIDNILTKLNYERGRANEVI